MLTEFLEKRTIDSISKNIRSMRLDFSGYTVMTECATGPYASTPIIALMAGADKIIAYGKNSKYGSFADAKKTVLSLAKKARLDAGRLMLTSSKEALLRHAREVDIVTNSGHLRPVRRNLLSKVKKDAVVALMYESWEMRPEDIDAKCCIQNSIPIIATNERHPKVGIFDFLGPIVIKALLNNDLEVIHNRIALVCDNAFAPYIKESLEQFKAEVIIPSIKRKYNDLDAVIFAQTPKQLGGKINIDRLNLPRNVNVCCQLWGDVNRRNFKTKWIPRHAPRRNYMGLSLADLGVESVVRLQSASLKAVQEYKKGKKLAKNSYYRIVKP